HALPIGGIHPRPGDDTGADHGPDVVLVSLHDAVDLLGRDQALLAQQRLKRQGARLHVRGRLRVMAVVVVVVVGAHASPSNERYDSHRSMPTTSPDGASAPQSTR